VDAWKIEPGSTHQRMSPSRPAITITIDYFEETGGAAINVHVSRAIG
jgi:hypothetical protein